MKNRYLSLLALLCLLPMPSWGGGLDDGKLYFGAGFGSAEVPELPETYSALQLIIGYPFEPPKRLGAPHNSFFIEGGYVDVSDNDFDSYYITPVYTRYLNSQLGLVLRAGFEAGHTTGRVGAIGLEYMPEPAIAVRVEYLRRSQSEAALLSLVYRP